MLIKATHISATGTLYGVVVIRNGSLRFRGIGITVLKWTNFYNDSKLNSIMGGKEKKGTGWYFYYGYGSWDEWQSLLRSQMNC